MEIIIVMVVVSIIITGSFITLSNDASDEIQSLPSEIEQVTKRALSTAKIDKRTQYILISPSHIWQSTDPDQTEPNSETTNQVDLPPNCSISYKRSEDTGWSNVQTIKDKAVWVYSVAGICEEMSLMIQLENSSAEIRFHPLTAATIKP